MKRGSTHASEGDATRPQAISTHTDYSTATRPEAISLNGGQSVVLIGHIAPLTVLEAEANEEELRSVEGISSHSRRAERLAWRILLRKAAERGTGVLVGAEQTAEKGAGVLAGTEQTAEKGAEKDTILIKYTPQGAPVLARGIVIGDSHYTHISVSHCRDKVAVMLSLRPCGIDIEQLARDFGRVSTRYITPDERALCQCEEFEAIAWCAKEALYKLAQIEGLDFRRDIVIEAIDLAAGTIVGRAGELQSVTMQILRPDKEHVAVATL